MKESWYWCDVVDRFELESVAEPEWDKVPVQRRDRVRANWEAARQERLKPSRYQMWGPQIAWYQRQPQYDVTVIGEVSNA